LVFVKLCKPALFYKESHPLLTLNKIRVNHDNTNNK
jgi:hypothetical protein